MTGKEYPSFTIEERLAFLEGQAVGFIQVLHVLMVVALEGRTEEDRTSIDATIRDLAARLATLPKQGANSLVCEVGAEIMLEFVTKTVRERLLSWKVGRKMS